MINGIHHTAISTRNLERIVEFYTEAIGCEVIFNYEWHEGNDLHDQVSGLDNSAARVAMLKAGNIYLEFFEYRSPTPVPNEPARSACDHGIAHICLDVTDIDAEYERLSKSGMVFKARPPHFKEMGVRAIYGSDPDGNVIELLELLTDRLGMRLPQLAKPVVIR
jgi:catechol 2,3-dioxygenase-like lactoylglutathione lyase family enzyme